jgi:hypothetical protein
VDTCARRETAHFTVSSGPRAAFRIGLKDVCAAFARAPAGGGVVK